MAKVILFMLGICLACVGVAGAIMAYQPEPVKAAEAMSTAPLPANTTQPTNTPTPTTTPSPTLDAAATALSLRATTAANEAAFAMGELEKERVRATESAVNIEATRQAMYFFATGTVSAADAKHQQGIETILASAKVLEQQNEAERLRQQDADRVTRIMTNAFAIIAILVIGGAIIWAIIASERDRKKPVKVAVNTGEPETDSADWDAVPYRIGHLTRYRMAEIFPDPERMFAFAVGISAGKSASHGEWVRAGGIFTEAEFTKMQNKLVEHRLAHWRSERVHRAGISFTTTGKVFFDAVLGHLPTPPPEEVAPSGAIVAGKRQIETPDGYEPVGEGEGQ